MLAPTARPRPPLGPVPHSALSPTQPQAPTQPQVPTRPQAYGTQQPDLPLSGLSGSEAQRNGGHGLTCLSSPRAWKPADDPDDTGHKSFISAAMQTGFCDWSARYFAQPVMKVRGPGRPSLSDGREAAALASCLRRAGLVPAGGVGLSQAGSVLSAGPRGQRVSRAHRWSRGCHARGNSPVPGLRGRGVGVRGRRTTLCLQFRVRRTWEPQDLAGFLLRSLGSVLRACSLVCVLSLLLAQVYAQACCASVA